MDPPDPLPPPDEPTKPQNEPLSIELEGKKKPCPSFNKTHTSHEVDASRASESAKDARDWLRKLQTMSEHIGERSEQGKQENSPKRAPGKPGSKMAVPGKPQDHQRSLEDDGKWCNDEQVQEAVAADIDHSQVLAGENTLKSSLSKLSGSLALP